MDDAPNINTVLARGDVRSAVLNTGLAGSWGFCLGCWQGSRATLGRGQVLARGVATGTKMGGFMAIFAAGTAAVAAARGASSADAASSAMGGAAAGGVYGVRAGGKAVALGAALGAGLGLAFHGVQRLSVELDQQLQVAQGGGGSDSGGGGGGGGGPPGGARPAPPPPAAAAARDGRHDTALGTGPRWVRTPSQHQARASGVDCAGHGRGSTARCRGDGKAHRRTALGARAEGRWRRR